METRVNVSQRMELCANRIAFLDEEIKDINSEREYLNAELAALTALNNLYATRKDDPIDSQRAEIFGANLPAQISPACTRGVSDLVARCIASISSPVSATWLEEKTGLTRKQVLNAAIYLKKVGVIRSAGRGTYIYGSQDS